MISSEHAEYVGRQFRKFRESEFLCDAIVATDDREFPVHSMVLSAASQVFKDAFGGGTEPNARIQVVGIDSATVAILLDAIYLGEIRLPSDSSHDEKLAQLYKHLRDLGVNEEHLARYVILQSNGELYLTSSRISMTSAVSSNNNVQLNLTPLYSSLMKISNKSKRTVASNLRNKLVSLNVCTSVNICSKDSDRFEISNRDIVKNSKVNDDKISSVINQTIQEVISKSSEYNQDNIHFQSLSSEEEKINLSNKDVQIKTCSNVAKRLIVAESIKYVSFRKTTLNSTKFCAKTVDALCNSDRSYKLENANLGMKSHEYIARNMKAYVCAVCSKAFSQPNYLLVHMRSHTGEQPYSCKICSLKFSQRSNLKRHEKLHSGSKVHLCDLCGKSFAQKVTLEEHQLRHGLGKPRQRKCYYCHERFFSRSALYKHMSSKHFKSKLNETEQRNFVAGSACKNSSPRFKNLTSVKIENNITLKSCHICEKKYRGLDSLRRHLLTHTNEKSHLCTTCGKKFLYRHSFEVHLRQHSGNKPYECGTCKKCFVQLGHLQSHMKSHSSEREFKCDSCNREYKHKFDLMAHRKKSFLCSTQTVA